MEAETVPPRIAETGDEELRSIKRDILGSGSLVLVIMPDAVVEWATPEELSSLFQEGDSSGRFDAGIQQFSQYLLGNPSKDILSWQKNFIQWSEVLGQFNIPDEQDRNMAFSKWLADNHYVGPTSRQSNGGQYDDLADNFYKKIAQLLSRFNAEIDDRGACNDGVFILDFSIDWRLYWTLKNSNDCNLDVELYNGILGAHGYLSGFEPVSLGRNEELRRPLDNDRLLKFTAKEQKETGGRPLLHWLMKSGVGNKLEFIDNKKFFDVSRVHIIKMCGVESSQSLALARSWMSGRLQSHDTYGCGLDKVFSNGSGSNPTSKVLIFGTGLLDPLLASIRNYIDQAMTGPGSDRKPVHIFNPHIPEQWCSPLKLAEMRLRQKGRRPFVTEWPTSLALTDIARLYQDYGL